MEKQSAFHMASNLYDVICARNIFTGLNMSWHVAELLVHVYFSIMWENRYKRSYALICDEFIARVYFIIFKKECPKAYISNQEDDFQSRPLVPGRNHHLHQRVWGHWRSTFTPRSFPRKSHCGVNMLSNHSARL